MTIEFTNKSMTNGGEPIELLRQLAYEYLAELGRENLIEFIETVGTDGFPVLLAVIPHAKIEDGKIVAANELPNDPGGENAVPIPIGE